MSMEVMYSSRDFPTDKSIDVPYGGFEPHRKVVAE